ncbi:hypothetical protein SDC9_201999 [bioreactor metagenome]|uniref:Uncharacterized protein n=1 Tax=bioreactor metagenome TaxID=1076179 RepID=A0A645IV77_9ZZZZ
MAKFFEVGIEHLFQLLLATGLAEDNFCLRHQVGDRGTDLMGNIS